MFLLGAIAILGYQSLLGDGTNASTIIPTIIAFAIPGILALLFVTGRSSVNGQLNLSRIVRGDMRYVKKLLLGCVIPEK